MESIYNLFFSSATLLLAQANLVSAVDYSQSSWQQSQQENQIVAEERRGGRPEMNRGNMNRNDFNHNNYSHNDYNHYPNRDANNAELNRNPAAYGAYGAYGSAAAANAYNAGAAQSYYQSSPSNNNSNPQSGSPIIINNQ
jgi:hypothetical protein